MSAIQKYAEIMSSIKLRTDLLSFSDARLSHLATIATIELRCLQVRKILEAIAMASLVANKDHYSRVHEDYASNWNAKDLLREIGRINPDFYPSPIKEFFNPDLGMIELLSATHDYMTKARFLEVYNKCGAILHTDNPFGSKIDYSYYEQQLPVWSLWITGLLNCHKIHLLGEETFWLIHMQEEGDNEVHYYVFEPHKKA